MWEGEGGRGEAGAGVEWGREGGREGGGRAIGTQANAHICRWLDSLPDLAAKLAMVSRRKARTGRRESLRAGDFGAFFAHLKDGGDVTGLRPTRFHAAPGLTRPARLLRGPAEGRGHHTGTLGHEGEPIYGERTQPEDLRPDREVAYEAD